MPSACTTRSITASGTTPRAARSRAAYRPTDLADYTARLASTFRSPGYFREIGTGPALVAARVDRARRIGASSKWAADQYRNCRGNAGAFQKRATRDRRTFSHCSRPRLPRQHAAMFETAHHRTVRNPGLVEISGIEGGKSSDG